MQREPNNPLLRERGFRGTVRNRNMEEDRRSAIFVLLALIVIIVLGLFLFGRTRLISDERMEKANYSAFLVKDDFHVGKLSPEKLQKLVGMYYAKDPANEDLKTLYDQGLQVS